tara:strand:- start:33 stop:1238 length:1206 start_codon:yes stop_codon:yes gene_type:complete
MSIDCINLHEAIRVKTDGTCTSCCLQSIPYKDEEHKNLNVRTHTLQEIINGETANKIRKDVANGIQNIYCKPCWDIENSGGVSKRIDDNTNRKDENFVGREWQPGEVKLTHLDMNMGTTCNIKCMTCGPESSAQWNKEFWAINESYHGIQDKKEYNKFIKVYNSSFDDDSLIWEELTKNKNTIESIDMYGGEPMLMKKQWLFLEELIKDGLASNIALHYNTNGTIWDSEKYDILKHFKKVSIDFSIDGILDRFEYMRFPANWREVLHNMNTIKQIEKFEVKICHTVSILNVWYMKEFLDYFIKWDYYLNIVHGPDHYNVKNLPTDIKELITEKYKEFPKVDKIIDYMNENKSEYPRHWYKEEYIEFFPELKRNIEGSDNFRGNDYSKTFPEFYEILKESGY